MEIIVNIGVWTIAVLFSLLQVFKFCKNVDKSLLDPEDFDAGWSIVGRMRDVSDYEWRSWKMLALSLLPWIFIHILLSNFFFAKPPIRKLWFCTLPIVFILYRLGVYALGIILFEPLAYWAVMRFRGKVKSVWTLTLAILLLVNRLKYLYETEGVRWLKILNISEDELYFIFICISWIQLRCISYTLEIVNNRSQCFLIDLLSYCLYLPLLFLGPIILYDDFEKCFIVPIDISYRKRLYNLFSNLSRYLTWAIMLELLLHYIYFNSMQHHVEIVSMMPDWCLYGGGVWMGLYFYLKYLVTYGISGSLSAVDNISPETPPICTLRVHLYSQMWRYFDVGLHKFLIKYLYKPVIHSLRNINQFEMGVRSIGSLICFIFVLLWHGIHDFIIVWTTLNFVGIIIENLGVAISLSSSYNKIFNKFLIDHCKDRLNAALSAPVLVISALSNFYFFAGADTGIIYVDRVLSQSVGNFLGMFLCVYCACRTSQFLNNVRARKIKMI